MGDLLQQAGPEAKCVEGPLLRQAPARLLRRMLVPPHSALLCLTPTTCGGSTRSSSRGRQRMRRLRARRAKRDQQRRSRGSRRRRHRWRRHSRRPPCCRGAGPALWATSCRPASRHRSSRMARWVMPLRRLVEGAAGTECVKWRLPAVINLAGPKGSGWAGIRLQSDAFSPYLCRCIWRRWAPGRTGGCSSPPQQQGRLRRARRAPRPQRHSRHSRARPTAQWAPSSMWQVRSFCPGWLCYYARAPPHPACPHQSQRLAHEANTLPLRCTSRYCSDTGREEVMEPTMHPHSCNLHCSATLLLLSIQTLAVKK